MKKIVIILYESNKEKENKSKDFLRISNDKYSITVIKINPYSFIGLCGERCDELYIDSDFLKSDLGKEIVNLSLIHI